MTPGIPNPKAAALLLVFLAAHSATPQTAQKTAPQQTVTVVVVNAHARPPQRVAGALVTLRYMNGELRAANEDSKHTGTNGEAYLLVSSDAPKRGDLRLEISGVTDLVIYEPADGQLTCPADQRDPSKCPYLQMTELPSRITVSLLPKGSPELGGATQIEAYLRRQSAEINSLQRQNLQQQGQIRNLQTQRDAAQTQADRLKQDVNAGLEEWAKANGLDIAEVQRQAQKWAQSVQADPAASAERRALAKFALQQYDAAGDDFGEALRAMKKRRLDEDRVGLQSELQTAEQQANSYQLAARFHDATVALEQTWQDVTAAQQQSPGDHALHEVWLSASYALAGARGEEGRFALPGQSLSLLAQAAQDYRTLAGECLSAADRKGWATAQIGLGDTLTDEGERENSVTAAALLDQAVEAYRNAQTVYTRSASPSVWARTQVSLGVTLNLQGARAEGDQAATLLDQAVQAFRGALEVNTRANLPQQWAQTQAMLGNALTDEGDRASGDQAVVLFGQAEQAFRNALQPGNSADQTQQQEPGEVGLGNVLVREGEHILREGEHINSDKATTLFEQAVQAYRTALEADKKANDSQETAAVQNGLGVALMDEARHAAKDKAADLLGQAVQAFRGALDVYTQTDLPQNWAMTQNNLGVALISEGKRTDGEMAKTLFQQAAQAYLNALQVYTKAADPFHYAHTMLNLSSVYKALGDTAAAQRALAEGNSVAQQ